MTVLLDNGSQIVQQTAFCRGRPAVIKSNIAIQENDFTEVNIFALSLYSIFIFISRMNNENDCVLMDLFRESDSRFSVDPLEKMGDTRLIPEITLSEEFINQFQ